MSSVRIVRGPLVSERVAESPHFPNFTLNYFDNLNMRLNKTIADLKQMFNTIVDRILKSILSCNRHYEAMDPSHKLVGCLQDS